MSTPLSPPSPATPAATPPANFVARWLDSDVGYSFRNSPVAMGAAAVALLCLFCALFAGWVSPHNPFDLATLDLNEARRPPAWTATGSAKYLLGTDDQGRDILSAVIYGARISLAVGVVASKSMRPLSSPLPATM